MSDIHIIADKVPAKHIRGSVEGVKDELKFIYTSLAYVCLIDFLMNGGRRQRSSFSRHKSLHETEVVKAKCILHDFEIIFGKLTTADVRRVFWSILNRTYECDGLVTRYMQFVSSMEGLLVPKYWSNSPDSIAIEEWQCIEQMGVALWQVTCNFHRSPMPSAPPPPYTLHASNIELPPIEWPDTSEPEVRLWSTKSEGSCKRSPAKGNQSAIIQNLLRFADNSSADREPKQQPRIVEISEGSEDEGGAPLPKCTTASCVASMFRGKHKHSPPPKTHISRAAPEDTFLVNNGSRVQKSQTTLISIKSS